jgi:hypothetical protein
MVWKACSTLMASLAEVSKYGMFPLDWHQVIARFCETCDEKKSGQYLQTVDRLPERKATNHALRVFHIDLVAKYYEREILWVMRAGLEGRSDLVSMISITFFSFL